MKAQIQLLLMAQINCVIAQVLHMSGITKNEAAEAPGDLSSSRTLGAWCSTFIQTPSGHLFTDTQWKQLIHYVHPGWGLADSGTHSTCWRLNEVFHISQKDNNFQIFHSRLYRAGAHSLINKAGKFGHSYRQLQSPRSRSIAWLAVLVTSVPLFTRRSQVMKSRLLSGLPDFWLPS